MVCAEYLRNWKLLVRMKKNLKWILQQTPIYTIVLIALGGSTLTGGAAQALIRDHVTVLVVAKSLVLTGPSTLQIPRKGKFALRISTFDDKPGVVSRTLENADGSLSYNHEFKRVSPDSDEFRADYAWEHPIDGIFEVGHITAQLPATRDKFDSGRFGFYAMNSGWGVRTSVSFTEEDRVTGEVLRSYEVDTNFTREGSTPFGTYSMAINSEEEDVDTWGLLAAEGLIDGQTLNQSSLSFQMKRTNILGEEEKIPVLMELSIENPETVAVSRIVFYPGDDAKELVSDSFKLNRSPNPSMRGFVTHFGEFSFPDGDLSSPWPDFTDYFITIIDPNDSDVDGIPDFSDAITDPILPEIQLIRKRSDGLIILNLVAPVHKPYRVEYSEDFDLWKHLESFTLQSPRIRLLDSSTASSRFYRIVLDL